MSVRGASGVVAMAIVAAALGLAVPAAQQDGGTPAPAGAPVRVPPSGTPPPGAGGGSPGETPGTATPAASSAAAATRLQFVVGENNVVRVPAETTTLTVTGVAGLDRLPAADVSRLAQSLAIADRGVSRGTAARGTFELLAPEFLGRSGVNGLAWRVPVKADVPLGTSHARIAALTFGAPEAQTFAVEFSVSAKPAAASQWTPRGATDLWTVSWSDPPVARVYGITIENPDDPIANVRLAQSTLKDATGRTIGVDRLRLLASPDAESPGALGVPSNSTRTLFLRLEDGAGVYGTFDGVVRLTADGSAAMKDVSLKIQASSTGRRWLGVVLAAVGLLLTLSLAALARPQMARLQARRAAAALRQSIAQFVAELHRAVPADVPTPLTDARAEQLTRLISDEALDRDNLLPTGFALGPGFDASPDMAASLKGRLDEVSRVLEGLYVLLRTGFPPVLRRLPEKRAEALALADALDRFAERVTGPQDAKTKADAVREDADKLAVRESGAVRAARDVTVADLDFQIRGLSLAAWLVWAAIALVIGASWIFSDPDYGTTTDLVASFAWGFGMTTFGAGIQNLTPASVATQMNVKVPK